METYWEQDEDRRAYDALKVEMLKRRLDRMRAEGYTTPQCVGCIYGLYQDSFISEREELALYTYVDPGELYNDCGVYWDAFDAANPLEGE